jgi:colanic acid/amylovoran biosynthesis glycosyltransferase
MLCGIPIIAYDIVGHPEVIFDSYTGFIVPFRDTAALADKMDYVARHPETSKQIGMQGRDFARIVFDKDKISQKESMFYKQILQR